MLALLDQTREPIIANEEEALIAREAVARLKLLADAKQDIRLRVNESADIVVPLPAAAVAAITRILVAMAERRPVSVIPMDAELTTQQAADMLNVSRPHLTKLVDNGKIPHHRVGTHRRILVADILDYRAAARAAQSKPIATTSWRYRRISGWADVGDLDVHRCPGCEYPVRCSNSQSIHGGGAVRAYPSAMERPHP